ncbi:MAG: glycosyltransferase [Ectothiorhodospiraceae bacterium]|nr:glycosyltransferase [Ectothiorhodospiraceae bacterium]
MTYAQSAMEGPIAAIVVVSSRYDDPEAVYQEYRDGLRPIGRPVEFTYVLDGPFPDVYQVLQTLQESGEPIRVIQLNRVFGEAAALSAAFRNTTAQDILLLPAFRQVRPDSLPRMLERLAETDLVVARRSPRTDSTFNRLQTRAFSSLVRFLTRTSFQELGCNVRALRRRVAEEVMLYGDQHRFLPILALNQGFRVAELPLPQSPADRQLRAYPPGTYVRRFIDLLTVFFITKFTRRPMRFYGLIGSGIAGIGAIHMAYLVVQRLFMGTPLADRPALLLAALLVVLGVQIFSMGLIGELIIYANAKQMNDYAIESIVEDGKNLGQADTSGRGKAEHSPPVFHPSGTPLS